MNSRFSFLPLALGAACLAGITAQAAQYTNSHLTSTVVDVYDGKQWVASFTEGASTVVLAGPTRTFSERTATYAVTHSFWVRTLPSPFAGKIDRTWLKTALAANRAGLPDIFGIAMEYIEGAPPVIDGLIQIAGDAEYGPLLNSQNTAKAILSPEIPQPTVWRQVSGDASNGDSMTLAQVFVSADETRKEGSDFNDYLGVSWAYPSGQVDAPEAAQFRGLDCSGYLRMVWGFRHSFAGSGYADSIPLCLSPLQGQSALPRHAFQICAAGPGVLVVPNTRTQVTDFASLMPGDLVFFDVSSNDGTQIDHAGMYLGVDAGGKHRFISSRKSINGPSLGDYKGASILEGTGLYARGFRAVRRL